MVIELSRVFISCRIDEYSDSCLLSVVDIRWFCCVGGAINQLASGMAAIRTIWIGGNSPSSEHHLYSAAPFSPAFA